MFLEDLRSINRGNSFVFIMTTLRAVCIARRVKRIGVQNGDK